MGGGVREQQGNVGQRGQADVTQFRAYTEATVQERIASHLTTAKDIGKKLLHKIVFMHDLVGIALREGLTTANNLPVVTTPPY
jgi:hypothetical protein